MITTIIHWVYIHFHRPYKKLYFIYKGISDQKEIAFLKENIKDGMTLVDIGANIGFYSLLLSKLVGKRGKVYAFEPEETNYKFLKKNVKGLKNISLYNYAVGDKDGRLKLYLSKNFNVDHRSYKTDDSRETRIIKCITLDKFFAEKEKIDLIKIDIQGFDYFAIRGGQKLIKRQRKIIIIGEFWPYGLKKAGVNAQEYLNLLKDLGLTVKIKINKPLDELESNKYFYTNFIAYKK